MTTGRVEFCTARGDLSRQRILEILMSGEMRASDIVPAFDMSLPTI